MSPEMKKKWDDSTIFIFRLSMSLLGFMGATFFTIAINYVVRMSDKLDAVIQVQSALTEWKIGTERRLDSHDIRLDNHAAAINRNKVD